MASVAVAERPLDVANKVLRRAQVSQMTRILQNRLALATVKVQNGWSELSLDSIEPQVDRALKRKRPTSSSNEGLSDTSSNTGDSIFAAHRLDSSPSTTLLFSDDLPRSGSSRGSKRSRYNPSLYYSLSHESCTARPSHVRNGLWNKSHSFTDLPPILSGPAPCTNSGRPASSMTDAAIHDDNLFSSYSEDDDSDLPVFSFQASGSRRIYSSPLRMPRTPSPSLARSARSRNRSYSTAKRDDAADLLMFLAASPSPAVPKSRLLNPLTTPPEKTPLPSSMLSTCGADNNCLGLGFGVMTPGMPFSFSDYLNVTPSPAQPTWRTPGPNKTPVTVREARHRLNFDSVLTSADLSNPVRVPLEVKGLGMELGGELITS